MQAIIQVSEKKFATEKEKFMAYNYLSIKLEEV